MSGMGGSRFGVVAAFSALLALDCGADPEPDPVYEMNEILAAIARAECRLWFQCCPPRVLALFKGLGTTEAECVDQSYPPSAFGVSLFQGRIAFDMDRARACLAQLESATCGTPDAQIDSTSCEMIESRVPAGQPCAEHYECIEGACDRDEFSSKDGTCAAASANGVACTIGTACSSRVCSGIGGGQCIDPLADGERCNYDGECASGECTCEMLTPSQRGCPGAIGVCETVVETGCNLD
jgi:hypothetical protein